MLGLLGLVVLNARKLSNHIKENIGFQVILKDTTTSAQLDALQQEISVSNYAKSVTHITKEQAAEKLKGDLGEDFQCQTKCLHGGGWHWLLASVGELRQGRGKVAR